MSSIQGKIKQYYLLINYLLQKPNVTKAEITDYFEKNDFIITQRTFFRLIESLRDDFGIDIVCDRGTNTYYINRDNTELVNTFLHFINSTMQAEFVINNIKDLHSLTKYIHFSDFTLERGLEYLQPILDSIKNNKEIEFEYEKFNHNKLSTYKLQPYLLKEYQNRWYVFGYNPNKQRYSTFGIDRMQNIQFTNNVFKKEDVDTVGFFDNIVGLNYDEHELQEVIIRATEIEAKYLRTQPLHKSQQEIKEKIFKFTLKPNYELFQMLMMRAAGITVLEPQWLRKQIRDELIEMLENYN